MKKYEKDEISRLPNKYKPLGAWRYFGYNILFSIPVIGFIFLIIFACSSNNINRRSYARSFFCVLLIVLVVFGIALALLALGLGGGLLEKLREFVQGIIQGFGSGQ